MTSIKTEWSALTRTQLVAALARKGFGRDDIRDAASRAYDNGRANVWSADRLALVTFANTEVDMWDARIIEPTYELSTAQVFATRERVGYIVSDGIVSEYATVVYVYRNGRADVMFDGDTYPGASVDISRLRKLPASTDDAPQGDTDSAPESAREPFTVGDMRAAIGPVLTPRYVPASLPDSMIIPDGTDVADLTAPEVTAHRVRMDLAHRDPVAFRMIFPGATRPASTDTNAVGTGRWFFATAHGVQGGPDRMHAMMVLQAYNTPMCTPGTPDDIRAHRVAMALNGRYPFASTARPVTPGEALLSDLLGVDVRTLVNVSEPYEGRLAYLRAHGVYGFTATGEALNGLSLGRAYNRADSPLTGRNAAQVTGMREDMDYFHRYPERARNMFPGSAGMRSLPVSTVEEGREDMRDAHKPYVFYVPQGDMYRAVRLHPWAPRPDHSAGCGGEFCPGACPVDNEPDYWFRNADGYRVDMCGACRSALGDVLHP